MLCRRMNLIQADQRAGDATAPGGSGASRSGRMRRHRASPAPAGSPATGAAYQKCRLQAGKSRGFTPARVLGREAVRDAENGSRADGMATKRTESMSEVIRVLRREHANMAALVKTLEWQVQRVRDGGQAGLRRYTQRRRLLPQLPRSVPSPEGGHGVRPAARAGAGGGRAHRRSAPGARGHHLAVARVRRRAEGGARRGARAARLLRPLGTGLHRPAVEAHADGGGGVLPERAGASHR